MHLYRLHLRPRSPWRTHWQADTLTGALCATAARVHGPEFLRSRLIDPMLEGDPPFILSDAFPGELLPVPAWLRIADLPSGANRKALKSARWLPRADFLRARAGDAPPPEHLVEESSVYVHETTRHNTLSRESDASLGEGGLFNRPETLLKLPGDGQPDGVLSIYFRAADGAAADLLLDLLGDLALTGFGADTATGRGQFTLAGDPVAEPELDSTPEAAEGVVSLSTFQPAPGDPIDGLWEAFPKFGRLGPDLALAEVRKRTLVMFRPGACFRADPGRPFLGRALPMDLILPEPSAATLRERGIEIIHPAFGLSVPSKAVWESAP